MEKKGTPQLTEEEMIGRIEAFKASGLSRRQFCKDNDYPMSNFYYWQKKYYEKFPEESESMKGKRGRRPKVAAEGAEGEMKAVAKPAKKKPAKKRKVKKTPKKITPKVKVEKAAPVPEESKRRGRPKRAESEAVAEVKPVAEPVMKTVKAAAPKAPKAVKEVKEAKGPVIVIRYPNGTRISVSAGIDLKRLKELINL